VFERERERALQEILDLFVVRVGESSKRLWIWCRSLVREESSRDSGFIAEVWSDRESAKKLWIYYIAS
jgi:hypothetical protein